MDFFELTRILASNSHGSFSLDQALDIKTSVSSSVGISYLKDAVKVQLRCLLEHLDFLQSQTGEVENSLVLK